MVYINNKVYLYGGIGRQVFSYFSVWDNIKKMWEKSEQNHFYQRTKADSGRSGHTICNYKKTIIMFGGERKFNALSRKRECYNDF